MIVKLKNVRLSFPDLFEPKAINNGAPQYGACFIFAPGHPAEAAIESAIDAVGKDKFKARWDKEKRLMQAGNKLCLKDGDTKDYDGYAGNLFVSANCKPPVRPLVLTNVRYPDPKTGTFLFVDKEGNAFYRDSDGVPTPVDDGREYPVPEAGDYVNASIEIWAQSNQYGKRINATLRGVQFYKEGDRFGGGGARCTADEFDDLMDGATADEFDEAASLVD